jgi:hypothetical protein
VLYFAGLVAHPRVLPSQYDATFVTCK